MSFGAIITNENNQIVIDGSYINVNVITKGVTSINNTVNLPQRDIYPMIFYKVPPAADRFANAVFSLANPTSESPRNRFGYTAAGGIITNAPPSMEYAACAIGPPVAPPAGTYGLKVFREDGAVVFNNLYNSPKIIAAHTQHGVGAGFEFNIAMPDASQNYWVAFPVGNILADSWYDSGIGEIMDVATVGAYWLNPSTLRITNSVTFQYAIGFGGRIVTHEDCYSSSVPVMVAQIT